MWLCFFSNLVSAAEHLAVEKKERSGAVFGRAESGFVAAVHNNNMRLRSELGIKVWVMHAQKNPVPAVGVFGCGISQSYSDRTTATVASNAPWLRRSRVMHASRLVLRVMQAAAQ